MKNIFFFFITLSIIASTCFGQASVTEGYKKTSKGLWYKILRDDKKLKAQIGDIMKLNVVYSTQRDSVLFSTYEQGQGPVQFTSTAPTFNGDPMEGFSLLGEGDSAVFLMPEDSAFKNQQPPPFAKKGEYIKIAVSVLSVMNKEAYEKQKAEEAQMETQMEAKTIEDYLAKNNLHAQKTPSGIYYVIKKQGDGAKAETGKTVTVDYTGHLLDGKVFDSNVDSSFKHVQPFSFTIGAGKVIKGWEEGFALFNVGTKGTLIIPSTLGWGSRANGAIPANSITIFDFEVLKVE